MNGSSLLEVLIALAIFSTVVLGAVAMSMQSLRFTRTALMESQALMQEVIIASP